MASGSQFPDTYAEEADKYKDNKFWFRQWIDASISYYHSYNTNTQYYQKLYDSYNGVKGEFINSYLTNLYGKKSKLKFIDYRLGRTKVKTLVGEYLLQNLKANVFAINREAKREKYEKKIMMLGLMAAKPQIEQVRKEGMPAYEGVRLPNPEEKERILTEMNLKTQTEVLMQYIINKKVEKERMKEKLYENLVDLVITSGEFGKIERDASGKETYRPIDLKNAIFAESANDPFLERSPFVGERRMMYKHEIYTMFPELDDTQKKDIETMVNFPMDYFEKDQYTYVNGITAIPVYFLEWKGIKPDYTKISVPKNSVIPYYKNLEYSEFDKQSTQNDIANKKYEVVTKYKQVIYTGVCIGLKLYLRMEEKTDYIQTRNGGSKFIAYADYVGCLFGTVCGVRISLQQVIDELSTVYNIIRFQINRELSKMKGKAIVYDRAYLPAGKNPKEVWRELTEEGYLEVDSSEDGLQNERAMNGVKEIDFGGSQSLPTLIQLGQDVERVMDLLTGIPKTRQGQSRASQTATSIDTDLSGSQSMTADLFYYHELFACEVLKRLAEKTKINYTWLQEELPGLLLSDDQVNLLDAIRDLSFDEFDLYLSDGRREAQIKEQIRPYFAQEINASQLRTQDLIKFERADTLSEGVDLLQRAWKEIQANAQASQMQQQQADQQMSQQQMQFNIQDKQGKYDHDLEKIHVKAEEDRQTNAAKAGVESKVGVAGQEQELEMQRRQQQHEALLKASENAQNGEKKSLSYD